jgi:hypothetical protein
VKTLLLVGLAGLALYTLAQPRAPQPAPPPRPRTPLEDILRELGIEFPSIVIRD